MGVTRNFMFSSILTVSNYIFPFIVYPYVARVLGVNNIGIVNFVDSIVNYAMLISLMGITIIGTRNIAKAKGNQEKLNATFSSLFLLTAAFTILATIGLISVTFAMQQLIPYRKLLLIGIVKLWGNFLLIDWLYKGLEDFRYITIRTILVKIGFLISVFIFIHTASDYITYFLLLCLMVAVNAAFNVYRAIKIVKFQFDFKYMVRSLGPFLILGFYLILNSMYTTFNVTYLGLKCGDEQVGYYTTATKVFKIILAFYTAYSSVVLPRASSLLAEGKHHEFKQLIMQSVQGLLLFSIPVSIFAMLFSPGIIYLIAGPEYTGAILPMIIVMPLIFIIGYEQILVIQILTPHSSDALILLNSFVGATVGIVGNILLVSHLQSIGSAIIWVGAEVAVLLTAQMFVSHLTNIRFPFKALFVNILAYVPYVIACLLFIYFVHIDPIIMMICGGVFVVIYFYFAQKLVLKNPVFDYCYEKGMDFINRKILHRN